MSVQLVLLKSGEEVIADIKEFRNSKDELVSYLFKDPHCVKVKTSQVLLEEEGTPRHEVLYYKWMSLSRDSDIIVNKDWVVCITDPLDSITKSYTERMNGRRSDDSNGSTNGRDVGASGAGSGGGGTSDSGVILNEQSEVDLSD